MARREDRLKNAFAAFLLAVLLTGCQSDPEPKFDPDATLSGGADTSPSPTPSEKPLDPVQVVKAWVKAQNTVMTNGDATDVYNLSTRDCSSCRGLIDPVVKVYEQGGHIERGHWRVDAAKKADDWPRTHEVGAGITSAAGRSWLTKNAQVRPFKSETNILLFKLRKVGEQWLVTSIVFLE